MNVLSFRYLFLIFATFLNVLAILLGFFIYSDQLSSTPQHLQIFVPDCPFYIFLFLLVLFGLIRNSAFSFLVSIGLAKYGVWTISVMLFYHYYYFSSELFRFSLLLILGHIGMILEGLAAIPSQIKKSALFLALGWFILNDIADYFFATAPILSAKDMHVAAFTFFLSFSITLSFFYFGNKLRDLPVVKSLRNALFSD